MPRGYHPIIGNRHGPLPSVVSLCRRARAGCAMAQCHDDYRAIFMRITIDLAEDIARHAAPAREALEAVAIEGYRSGALSAYQARTLLGVTRFEFDGFLKDRNIWEHAYSQEDLERDRETLALLDSETGAGPLAR